MASAEKASLDEMLYGPTSKPEEKAPKPQTILPKDLSKKRAALAAMKLQQYNERLTAKPKPNAPNASANPTSVSANPSEEVPIQKKNTEQPTLDKGKANIDLEKFDKSTKLEALPVLKSATVNVDVS